MKSRKSPEISFYVEDLEGGVIIFGYEYYDFFDMVEDVGNKISKIASFCKRNKKRVSHKFYYRDIDQWELQIIVDNEQ